MGIAEHASVVGDETAAWCVARGEVVAVDLPVRYGVGFGERGSTIAYSDLDTGLLHLWHPGESSAIETVAVDAQITGRIEADMLAVSPDERLLVIARLVSPEASPDAFSSRAYLVDLESSAVTGWDWVQGVQKRDRLGAITSMVWGKASDVIYVSLGDVGAETGKRSYSYDLSTGDSLELTGIGTVLDAGLQGQVVGLGTKAASTSSLPGGAEVGYRSLVLWQGGESVELPRDPEFVELRRAWIADDGRTIVAYGSTPSGESVRNCLEVLQLADTGWAATWLYVPDDSLDLVLGVAFEPNSNVFWFQAGSDPVSPVGLVRDVRLFELDIDTRQAIPSMRLPGQPGDFSIARSIVGTICCGGT